MPQVNLAIACWILLLLPALYVQPGFAAALTDPKAACSGTSCINGIHLSTEVLSQRAVRSGGGRGGGNGSPNGSPDLPPNGEGGGYGGGNENTGMTPAMGGQQEMTDPMGGDAKLVDPEPVCTPGSKKRACTGLGDGNDPQQNPEQGQGQTNPPAPITPAQEDAIFENKDVDDKRKEGKLLLKKLDDVSGADEGIKIRLDQDYLRVQTQIKDGDKLEGGDYLKDFHVATEGKGWSTSTVRNQPPTKNTVDILKTHEKYDSQKNDGSIVVLWSFNAIEDKIPKGDPKRRYWSDMVMDNWRLHCERNNGDVKNLKYMARHDIGTEETVDVMQAVVKHTGGDKTVMNTFRYEKLPDEKQGENIPDKDREENAKERERITKERESFEALAGSDHGSRVLQMLLGHHNEMGDLKIKAFHVYLSDSKAGGNLDNIVIEFGH